MKKNVFVYFSFTRSYQRTKTSLNKPEKQALRVFCSLTFQLHTFFHLNTFGWELFDSCTSCLGCRCFWASHTTLLSGEEKPRAIAPLSQNIYSEKAGLLSRSNRLHLHTVIYLPRWRRDKETQEVPPAVFLFLSASIILQQRTSSVGANVNRETLSKLKEKLIWEQWYGIDSSFLSLDAWEQTKPTALSRSGRVIVFQLNLLKNKTSNGISLKGHNNITITTQRPDIHCNIILQ